MVPTTGAVGGELTVTLLVAEQPVAVSVNVMVTGGPPSTAVIKPLLFMEIILGSLLTQVPPVFGVTFAVDPKQTVVAPANTGSAFTVKLLVLLQPSLLRVKNRVTVPAVTPVTTPAFVMVALAVLPLIHVPPAGVTFAVAPTHTAVAPPKTGAPGTALIATLPDAGDVQLLALVTVKV
jgi:hypothetical protein